MTDGVPQGCFVVREGPRTSHCEPRSSVAEVATIRADVIAKSWAFGGVTPLRAVSLSVAGASEAAAHTLPNSAHLKRSAQNSIYRARKKVQIQGEAGQLPNCKNLEDLSLPESATRRADGEDFLLHDSGPVNDRILLFGTQINIRSPAVAEVWGADGISKAFPALGLQVYTIRAAIEGYCLPCVYALLPNKSQGAHKRMWGEIKNLIGEEADRDRICTMDFGRASISAFTEAFQASSVVGCIFHLWQSLYRKVQQIGISGKYQAGGGFRLRVKTLSALAFPPLAGIVEGREQIEPGFPDVEQEFLA